MPRLDKKALSQFIRSGCLRRLRLDLYPAIRAYAGERADQEMPDPVKDRPGVADLQRTGREWEQEVFDDVISTFGDGTAFTRHENPHGDLIYDPIELREALSSPEVSQILIEATFNPPRRFLDQFTNLRRFITDRLTPNNEEFDIARTRPDLIFVSPARRAADAPEWTTRRLTSSGEVQSIDARDARRALRIVDIKMTASPSAAYLCEVAYYAWAMAVWLEDVGLDQRFFVSAEPGVWPGSLDGSTLGVLRRDLWNDERRLPTEEESWNAIQEDVEFYSVELFVERVRAFFEDDVIEALSPIGASWRAELPWHINSGCIGCDYLGYGWFNNPPRPGLCWREAMESGHLSRISGLSQGAAEVLRQNRVLDVGAVAAIEPDDTIFESHHTLKAKRTAIHARAQMLGTGRSRIVDRAGTSAVLPSWSDVNLYVRADFDIASGRTICFSFQGFAYINGAPHNTDGTFFVEDPTPRSEERACLNFLGHIHDFIRRASDPRSPGAFDGASDELLFQCYVWDELTLKHLQRVIGRHLVSVLADSRTLNLAWLFPPDQVFDDPNFSGSSGPISVVSDAVNAILAADIPHRYTLLQVADLFRHEGLPVDFSYNVNDLFRDPLSDQVPSERAHEIWTKREGPPRNYQEIQHRFGGAAQTYLRALENVTRACREALRGRLRTNAPPLSIVQPRRMDPIIGWDLQIILEHRRLNAKARELDIEVTRSLPAHEREARFRSVRLTRLITGEEETETLARIGRMPSRDLLVFSVSPLSVDAKINEGDFTWSLLPDDFFPTAQYRVAWHENDQGLGLDLHDTDRFRPLGAVTCVTVLHFDRGRREIVFELTEYRDHPHRKLIEAGMLDYTQIDATAGRHASLNEWPADFFTKKLSEAVRRIGDPQLARNNPLTPAHQGAHIRPRQRRARPTAEAPAAEFIWSPADLVDQEMECNLAAVNRALEAVGSTPTPTQQQAIEHAVSRRLTVLWGPPGSGKSKTSAELILGLLASADALGGSVRVLITGPTWISIANVFSRVAPLAEQMGIGCTLHWLGSTESEPIPGSRVARFTREYEDFCELFEVGDQHMIVGSTSQQVGNLMNALEGAGLTTGVFDLILLDEASQMDVANTLCVLQSMTENGSLVLVGDDLQMPPIQESDPPLGYEEIVGSVFSFYSKHHQIPKIMLDRSFRSNDTIIDFVRESGYGPGFRASYPDRALLLNEPIPTIQPATWSRLLPWSDVYRDALLPERPLVAIRHREGISAQASELEAQWVAGMVVLLASHLGGYTDSDLGDDVVAQGDWDRIFGSEIGVVTPHRAQLSRIVTLLQIALPMVPPELIRSAVDTVERFQGQERTSIITSFAVGDPDAIAMEEEFLFNLQRFNVIASRARVKLIVLMDESLWRYLPTETALLPGARLLKRYGGGALPEGRAITLRTADGGNDIPAEMRWRTATN